MDGSIQATGAGGEAAMGKFSNGLLGAPGGATGAGKTNGSSEMGRPGNPMRSSERSVWQFSSPANKFTRYRFIG